MWGLLLGCFLAISCIDCSVGALQSCKSHQRLFAMQDEYRDEPFTVIEADFYGANVLMPLPDDALVAKVASAV